MIFPFSPHHFSLLTTELPHPGAYTSGGVGGLFYMSATNLELYNQLNCHLESGPLAEQRKCLGSQKGGFEVGNNKREFSFKGNK